VFDDGIDVVLVAGLAGAAFSFTVDSSGCLTWEVAVAIAQVYMTGI